MVKVPTCCVVRELVRSDYDFAIACGADRGQAARNKKIQLAFDNRMISDYIEQAYDWIDGYTDYGPSPTRPGAKKRDDCFFSEKEVKEEGDAYLMTVTLKFNDDCTDTVVKEGEITITAKVSSPTAVDDYKNVLFKNLKFYRKFENEEPSLNGKINKKVIKIKKDDNSEKKRVLTSDVIVEIKFETNGKSYSRSGYFERDDNQEQKSVRLWVGWDYFPPLLKKEDHERYFVTMNYTLNGSQSGKNGDINHNVSLRNSYYDRKCELNNPLSGTKETIDDGEVVLVDFGNGSCDGDIIITERGKTLKSGINPHFEYSYPTAPIE